MDTRLLTTVVRVTTNDDDNDDDDATGMDGMPCHAFVCVDVAADVAAVVVVILWLLLLFGGGGVVVDGVHFLTDALQFGPVFSSCLAFCPLRCVVPVLSLPWLVALAVFGVLRAVPCPCLSYSLAPWPRVCPPSSNESTHC